MLLFYSNHCTASRMLVDSIKRYNGLEHLKLVNVENYKAKGVSIPAQIHSVPALLFPDTKKVIFGKQVFDFLLLPNKGFLFNLPKKESGPVIGETMQNGGDPLSFSLTNSLSDSYSFIDADNPDPHKSYVWSGVDENIVIPTILESEKESKRGQSIPDLGLLKSQRDMQLQDFLT